MYEFLQDLFAYAKEHKKLWIVPLILLLAGIAALLVLSASTPLAPFIYTMF